MPHIYTGGQTKSVDAVLLHECSYLCRVLKKNGHFKISLFLDAPDRPVTLDGLLENVKFVFLPHNTVINLATEYNYRTH